MGRGASKGSSPHETPHGLCVEWAPRTPQHNEVPRSKGPERQPAAASEIILPLGGL